MGVVVVVVMVVGVCVCWGGGFKAGSSRFVDADADWARISTRLYNTCCIAGGRCCCYL